MNILISSYITTCVVVALLSAVLFYSWFFRKNNDMNENTWLANRYYSYKWLSQLILLIYTWLANTYWGIKRESLGYEEGDGSVDQEV